MFNNNNLKKKNNSINIANIYKIYKINVSLQFGVAYVKKMLHVFITVATVTCIAEGSNIHVL